MTNVIPPMTDSLGRYWKQPPRERILVDDTHALMAERDFLALLEYSSTKPGVVYPGKMWRRHDGIYDKNCPRDRCRWLLCWYGEVPGNPKVCSVNFRDVLLHDAPDPNASKDSA